MLAILLPAVIVGAVAGWLRAGRTLPDRLPLRGAVWIVLSFAVQVMTLLWARPAGPIVMGALLIGAMLLLLMGVWYDRSPAMVLVALGIVLNLVVMIANGGLMPLATDAIARQGLHPGAAVGEIPTNAKGRIVDGSAVRLRFLADVIEAPNGGLLSLGDIVLAIGTGVLAWERLGRRAGEYA